MLRMMTIHSKGQNTEFVGRGVPPAYNVLAGETPAPKVRF